MKSVMILPKVYEVLKGGEVSGGCGPLPGELEGTRQCLLA